MWFSAIRLAVLAVLAFNLASILAQSAENECVEIRDFTNKSCEVCGELKTPCRIYKPTGCNICPPASKTTSKMASKTTSNDHKLTSDSPRLNLSTENFDFEVDTSNMTTKDHSILVKVQNHFSLVNILTGSGVTVAVVLSAIFAYLKREVIKAFITRAIRFFKKVKKNVKRAF